MIGCKLNKIGCLCAAVACGVLLAVLGATPAFAEEQPWWSLDFRSAPTHLQPGAEGLIEVSVANVGDQFVNASRAPVTITDKLPAGVTALAIKRKQAGEGGLRGAMECGPLPSTVVTCTWGGPEPLPTYEELELEFYVKVAEGAKSGENEVTVSGGEGYACNRVKAGEGRFIGNFCRVQNLPSEEGPGEYEGVFTGHAVSSASYNRPVTIGPAATPFGIEAFSQIAENEGGSVDAQAGSHPFQLSTTIAFNEGADIDAPPALVKDVRVKLPPGLVGNPTPLPQCSTADFTTVVAGPRNLCPENTVIGVAITNASVGGGAAGGNPSPIYNLAPEIGEPARFGFLVVNAPITLDTAVRTGSDYGVTVTSSNISQLISLLYSRIIFWGVPGDPRHDLARGVTCLQDGQDLSTEPQPCVPLDDTAPTPFLMMPTACGEPLRTGVEIDSWKAPEDAVLGESEPRESSGATPAMDGCNKLPFSPELSDTPDGQAGSTPTGLTIGVHVPQDASLNPTGLAQAAVKDTTVTLPEGVALNPAGADGLEACSESQVGFLGRTAAGVEQFTSGLPEPFCPNGSKIGTVTIKTPLLPNPLEGAVYLTAQNANPFGSLVAMYLVAQDPISGTLIKVPGEVKLDQQTGQITATFLNTPDLPFEDLALHFFGGERAPLATPPHCGSYTTTGSVAPWSGSPPAALASTFQIVSGPNGTPCEAPLPFDPTLTAGTTSIQAGGFSPFTMTMSREDGNQNLEAIKLRMPPGMLGTLSTVKLCGEAQADAGTCGPESLIGHTTVSVGLGGDPYSVTGGQVFVTGPYQGAPYGLSIVVPAKAGPYNFGTVVVRAKIEVNPITAQLTITTDDEGPYKIPTILEGIPLEIKHVNVSIDRPGFTFNATNCSPLQITGSLTSTEGASAALAVPYQITNCAVLAFKPKLTASTSGKTSRANGASLHVKLSYPAGPYDANIARVKVELPKKLPSRLTTLQKACLAATFETNPADCPAASIIGQATATTPVLPVPLSGPAYFVSHGGEAFPSLIVVLQGYGATVDLVGSTYISKQGITSSTFKTVPDVPVGTFELTLPEGPYSALAANGNLCKASLAMPTEFLGQNGALIKTSTKITPTGCSKAKVKGKSLTRAQKRQKALKACKQDKAKAKRTKCEASARKRYGRVKAKKKGKK